MMMMNLALGHQQQLTDNKYSGNVFSIIIIHQYDENKKKLIIENENFRKLPVYHDYLTRKNV